LLTRLLLSKVKRLLLSRLSGWLLLRSSGDVLSLVANLSHRRFQELLKLTSQIRIYFA
jgi:hypothetical protein